MTALVILAAVILALALLGQVRLGAAADYDGRGLRLRVKLGPLRFRVYPRPPGPPKPGRRKQKKKEPDKPREKPAPLSLARRYLPLAADAAGRLRRKIRIDRFALDFTAGAPDPASAALCFGGANALIGMLWPLVEQNFNVRDRSIRTRVDFDAREPVLSLSAAATLTVAQALSLALRLAVRFLKINSQSHAGAKAPATQKEAV